MFLFTEIVLVINGWLIVELPYFSFKIPLLVSKCLIMIEDRPTMKEGRISGKKINYF